MSNNRYKIDFEKNSLKLKDELLYFKEYIQFNVSMLNERKKKISEMLNQDISENPKTISILEQIYLEEDLRLPSYFYHSTIVSLFSLLETNLNAICETIIQETSFTFRLDEITNRNIVNKAKVFLTKMADIDFSQLDKIWIEITTIQKIRNLIVHNNSHLKNDNIQEDVMRLIKKNGTIQVYKFNKPFYLHNDKLLTDFLNSIEEFVSSILKQLGKMEFVKFEKAEKVVQDFDELPF